MADPYYKRTPYGWCLDHLHDNKYNTETDLEYVIKIEDFLNKLEVNYSVIQYKSMVRVHVYFSAIKKMGYRNAVDLYWLSSNNKYKNGVFTHSEWGYKDVEKCVKKYFIENDLEIE